MKSERKYQLPALTKLMVSVLLLALIFGTIIGIVAPRKVKAITSWLTDYQYRKAHTIYSATGAGADYQVKVTVYKGTIPARNDLYYALGKRTSPIAGNPDQQHSYQPVHNTNIMEVNKTIDGAIRKYIAYDSDYSGTNLYLYYCDDLDGVWTAYSGNPIMSSGSGHYRWPSTAYVNGTFQMFIDDYANGVVKRYTSDDGINFTYQEDVITGTPSVALNPYIWLNPNDSKWYLFYRRYVGLVNYISVKSSVDITNLAGAASSDVISRNFTFASPSVMYRDGQYWLLTEQQPVTNWEIDAYSSSSVDSGYVLSNNSPILVSDEACPVHLLSPDGSKAYLYTTRDSANWYIDQYLIQDYKPGLVSAEDHAKSDFSDVKFTASDGTTLLNYWVEDKVDDDYATFWVKVTDDLSSEDAAIYIYYGNSSAVSESDGSSTFEFFDDFSEGSVDWTNRWQSTDHSYYSVSGGVLRLNAPSSSSQLLQTKSSYNGSATEVKLRQSVGDKQAYFDFEPGLAAYTDKDAAIIAWNIDTMYTKLNGIANGISRSDNLTDYFKIVYENPPNGVSRLHILLSGSELVRKEANPATRTVYPSLLSWQSGGIAYADDIFIRKYVSSGPGDGGWGDEQFFAEPSLSAQSASAVTTSSAVLNGAITTTAPDATLRGFKYYSSSNCSGAENIVSESGEFTAVTFSLGISLLSANTDYSYKAYATNLSGTGTSTNCVSFKTENYSSGSAPSDTSEEIGNASRNSKRQRVNPIKYLTKTLARFSISNPTISGSEVVFDASDSYPVDGIERYDWDFGDGQKGSSISAKISHTFLKPGRYNVTLVVYSKDDESDSVANIIDVKPVSPEITNIKAEDKALRIVGTADPDTIVYLTIHSDPYYEKSVTDGSGNWSYLLDSAEDTIGEGDHTIKALAAVKLSDNSELKSEESRTYDFYLTVDDGKLKVEIRKTKIWQRISLVLFALLVFVGIMIIRKRKR